MTLRVRDNGIGFDHEYREKLFKPFERIHDASHFPGTGVGLATVARVAARHGGSVDAQGELGAGATFSLTLPAAPLRSATHQTRDPESGRRLKSLP